MSVQVGRYESNNDSASEFLNRDLTGSLQRSVDAFIHQKTFAQAGRAGNAECISLYPST